MSILAWIVVGFIAGGLARMATGSRKRGCIGTIIVGVLGGLLGGVIFSAAAHRPITHFGLWSIFVAFIGACLLLLLLEAISGGRRRSRW